MNPTFKARVHNIPFEDSQLTPNFYDIALTSPPYYDSEKYSDEPSNSLNRYNSFQEWCIGFYIPLITKTMAALKPGAVFILNIGSRMYPLNQVLLDTFQEQYPIKKLGNYLSGNGKSDKEGEMFYEIRKPA